MVPSLMQTFPCVFAVLQAYTRGRFRVSCFTCCVTQPPTLCGADSDPVPGSRPHQHLQQQQQQHQRRPQQQRQPGEQQQQREKHQASSAAAVPEPDACNCSPTRDQGHASLGSASFHDCAASRSSLDSTSSLLSSCTEDGCKRANPPGILRRNGSTSAATAAGSIISPTPVRRVRFSDTATAMPPAPALAPSAAAAVAAVAARPSPAGSVSLPSATRSSPSVFASATAVAAAAAAGTPLAPPTHFLPLHGPGAAQLPAPSSPVPIPGAGSQPMILTVATEPFAQLGVLRPNHHHRVAGVPQAVTRSYQRGRFAVQEGVLLIECHSSDFQFHQSPLDTHRPLAGHLPRSTSLPDTNSYGLLAAAAGMQAAAAAATAASCSFPGLSGAAPPRHAGGGSCPELPTLAEEDRVGILSAECDSVSSGESAWGSGSAASAPSVCSGLGNADAGSCGDAPKVAAAPVVGAGVSPVLPAARDAAGASPYEGRRPQAVSYFRRGRFLVSSSSSPMLGR